ncbi:MAG: hypothetical protein HGB35_03315 [Geobacteraceae bacterium]|nr:hypothetical protein [Geobacteraceae bacterium]
MRCGSCRSAMSPSYAYANGKKYFYYRCTVDNDRSKTKCRIGSVNGNKVEELVVNELKFLAEDPRIIEGVVENATKDQRVRAKELTAKKRSLQDSLTQIDKKAKNLIDILGQDGNANKRSGYLIKQVDELDIQAGQLRDEMEVVDFEIHDLENKFLSTELIKENFKVFNDVYDHLTIDEKYDLLHLLIKKITYYEEPATDTEGIKQGKIKMDLWELPPIDPSILRSTDVFAESIDWLPFADSNHGQGD